jgi:hypothetical protein
MGRSLALARGANPHAPAAGSFDQHLNLALQAGVGSGASVRAAGDSATGKAGTLQSSGTFSGNGSLSSLEALRSEHRTAVAQFEERFLQLMRENGIDPGEEVVFRLDADRNVQVAGNHPQKAAIERLLVGDVELRNLFMRLSEQASVLRAADFATELAHLQAEAPADAATRVQQLLNTASPPTFSLTVRPGETHLQIH